MLSFLKLLPIEIINLIKQHLSVLKIQNLFKVNRPLTLISKGDRVMILNLQLQTRQYCTIDKIYSNFYKVKLLPRIIPFWKKCNFNFWSNMKNYNIIPEYNFPYYTPKKIKVSKQKIIKLKSWNDNSNLDNLDASIRLNMNFNNFRNINTEPRLFQYLF